MSVPDIQVCFGPKTASAPSWEYFELLARELSRLYGPIWYVDKKLAKKVHRGVFFVIKNNTYLRYLDNAVPINDLRKIIYLPIDRFSSLEEVDEFKSQLPKINFMVINSPQLIQYYLDCPNVVYIPHHIKYYLKELPRYNPGSFLLWEGARTNLQYFADWVANNDEISSKTLYVLTNGEPKEIHSLYFTHLKNVVCWKWSPHLLMKFLRKCWAVIDIKGDSYKQLLKPPTKAFQYLSSGVPFLLNASSPYLDFFRTLGVELNIAEHLNQQLTYQYWKHTQEVAPMIRKMTNIKTVTQQYNQLIERCYN